MVVGVPIVALTEYPLKRSAEGTAGVVVPPAEPKRASVDAPLPDVVAVMLVVGTKIASKEQAAEMTFVKVALVVPLGPVASAYAQPMNL